MKESDIASSIPTGSPFPRTCHTHHMATPWLSLRTQHSVYYNISPRKQLRTLVPTSSSAQLLLNLLIWETHDPPARSRARSLCEHNKNWLGAASASALPLLTLFLGLQYREFDRILNSLRSLPKALQLSAARMMLRYVQRGYVLEDADKQIMLAQESPGTSILEGGDTNTATRLPDHTPQNSLLINTAAHSRLLAGTSMIGDHPGGGRGSSDRGSASSSRDLNFASLVLDLTLDFLTQLIQSHVGEINPDAKRALTYLQPRHSMTPDSKLRVSELGELSVYLYFLRKKQQQLTLGVLRSPSTKPICSFPTMQHLDMVEQAAAGSEGRGGSRLRAGGTGPGGRSSTSCSSCVEEGDAEDSSTHFGGSVSAFSPPESRHTTVTSFLDAVTGVAKGSDGVRSAKSVADRARDLQRRRLRPQLVASSQQLSHSLLQTMKCPQRHYERGDSVIYKILTHGSPWPHKYEPELVVREALLTGRVSSALDWFYTQYERLAAREAAKAAATTTSGKILENTGGEVVSTLGAPASGNHDPFSTSLQQGGVGGALVAAPPTAAALTPANSRALAFRAFQNIATKLVYSLCSSPLIDSFFVGFGILRAVGENVTEHLRHMVWTGLLFFGFLGTTSIAF